MHSNDRRPGVSKQPGTPGRKRTARRGVVGAVQARRGRDLAPDAAALSASTDDLLAALLAELTGQASGTISPDASPIENGLDSLLALQLRERIALQCGVMLPPHSLLGATTLREVGAELRRLVAQAPGTPPPDAASEASSRAAVQRDWWLMDALEGPGEGHHVALLLRLDGPLDLAALRRAWQVLAARHAGLRPALAEPAAAPLAAADKDTPELPLQPLAGADAALRAHALDAAVDAARRLPFDLRRGPWLRAALWQLGDTRHALLLVAHRMVGDERSLLLLAGELGTLHGSIAAGNPPAPPTPAQAAARRPAADAADALASRERLIAHWRRRLAGQPALDLPRDRGHAGLSPRRMERVALELPAELSAGLRTLARRENVTLFMLLLSAYKVLLMRISGQTDLCVSTPMSARTCNDLAAAVGNFTHLVPLRTDLAGQPSFRQVLARVRDATLQGLEHMAVPTPWLVCAPGGDGGKRSRALAQAGFALDSSGAAPRWRGLRVQARAMSAAPAGLVLDLHITDHHGSLHAELSHDSAAFEASTALRWLEQFLRIVEQVVAEPGQPIGACDIVGERERARVLRDWNQTDKPYPRETRCDELVALQARRSPDALAVRLGEQSLRYAELDHFAQGLAGLLALRGVAAGQRVGICMRASPQLLVALLAVMKSGAAFVMLDPSWPRDRLAFVVGDAGLALVLAQGDAAQALPPLPDRLLDIDIALRDVPNRGDAAPPAPATSEHLAGIVYTQGSNGRPKGVEIAHRSLTNLLWSMRQTPGCGASDVLLSLASPSGTAWWIDWLLPLIVGARVELLTPEESVQTPLLLRRLKELRPTLLQATPSTWRMLLDAGFPVQRKLVALSCGETLPQALATRLLDRVAALWNLYGAAETTGCCLLGQVRRSDGRASIGRPIANTRAYVLDETRRPVAIGMPGELCIGGDAVARGYLGSTEAGAARFIADPFSDDPDARLHATGDLARLRDDGSIEHLGRLRAQWRVGGVRIVVDEVEAALSLHPQVQQAALGLLPQAGGAQQLVAWVQRRGEVGAQAEQLRDFLRSRVPPAMLPARFVFVSHFPRSAQGTLDLLALPAPDESDARSSGRRGGPRSTLETQLLADWRLALGRDDIGVDADFFGLGGGETHAQGLLQRMAQWSQRTFTLADLFQAPTVAAMARHLSRSGWAPSWQAMVSLQRGTAATPIFLLAPVEHDALHFTALARALGDDRPLYALQLHGLRAQGLAPTSVTSMAARCVSEIRSVLGSGVCCVAGAGSGCAVAVEVAQQLLAQGVQARLALFDSDGGALRRAPPQPDAWPVAARRMASAWWQRLRGAVPRPVDDAAPMPRAAAGDAPTDAAVAPVHDLLQRRTILQALDRHRARPFTHDLLHVVAASRSGGQTVRPTSAGLAGATCRQVEIDAAEATAWFDAPQVEGLAQVLAAFTDGSTTMPGGAQPQPQNTAAPIGSRR